MSIQDDKRQIISRRIENALKNDIATDIANAVARTLNASDAGMAVTVEWDNDAQQDFYVMWCVKDGLMKKHALLVSVTPAERLEAHLHGFIENIKSLDTRMFHVVARNVASGQDTICTSTPVTHKEAATIISKFSVIPQRTMRLQEV